MGTRDTFDMADPKDDGPIRIKKYANRRLYNTASSCYVTLADLGELVHQGVEFTVEDAKTGEDLTRAILTQIIVEEEQKGSNLLPIAFLRRIISMYRDNMGWMLPPYLEQSMEWFEENQGRLRREIEHSLAGAGTPFGSFGEIQKRNLELFDRTMRMLNPFAPPAQNTPPPDGAEETDDELDDLRQEINRMHERVERLARERRD